MANSHRHLQSSCLPRSSPLMPPTLVLLLSLLSRSAMSISCVSTVRRTNLMVAPVLAATDIQGASELWCSATLMRIWGGEGRARGMLVVLGLV